MINFKIYTNGGEPGITSLEYMKIADGLDVLELKTNGPNGPGIFNAALIWDDNAAILVDTGVPGLLDTIKNEFNKAGVSLDRLEKIIITHHDMDHIGSLASIIKASSHKIDVMAHEGEKPYIQGEKTPIKMTPERIAQIKADMDKMPQEKRDQMKAMYEGVKVPVDILLNDEEELPYCGGIVVIHTPGHTPGHICLYLKKYKALVTGDGLNVFDGKLHGPNPQYTYNMEEALRSLEKLTKYDIETVICYHGGIFKDDPNGRIRELIK